jgi:hypothetical protein
MHLCAPPHAAATPRRAAACPAPARAPARLPQARRKPLPAPPRVASNQMNAAPPAAAADASSASAAAGCPFAALKAQLAAVPRPQPLPDAGAAAPGPAPFSLQSLSDVMTIFLEGLHVAMLKFSEKYGPVCRWVPGWPAGPVI